MKKIPAMAFCVLLLLALFSGAVSAEEAPLELNCKAAMIMEAETGKVLYEYHSTEKLAPASVTKVMSALLFMDAIEAGALHYEDRITASAHAVSMGGSQIWLEVGEQMTVDELLRATMIGSANDATVALAEAVSGSEEAFAQRMNTKAAELGLKNSHFCNASGLDEEGHYTTAGDVAVLCCALLKHKEIMKYSTVWMDSLRDGKTQLVNTNKLVRTYDGITGLKTGTTDKAGRCLAASAKRGKMHIVAVIMGCTNNPDRYGGAQKMLNWAFANYEATAPKDAVAEMPPLPVKNGKIQSVRLFANITKPIVLKKGTAKNLTYKVSVAKDIQAPVEEGQTVGKVEVLQNDTVLTEYPIQTAEKVEQMNFITAITLFLRAFLNIS